MRKSTILRPTVVATMLLAFGVSRVAADVVLHVDDSITVPGDGLTWATGMNDLQAALTAAAAPGSGVTEIRVAQGTYLPTLRTIATDPRSVTFRLIRGVVLRGGYAGIAHANPDEWLPSTHRTTLSGDLAGDDHLNGGPGDDNAYHVALHDGPYGGGFLTIAGLTITGGNANMPGNTLECRGGGLCVINGAGSGLIISDCVLERNRAKFGGSLYMDGGYTSIQSSRILSNRATSYGGGVLLDGGNLVVNGCEIAHNVAETGGGAGIDTHGNYTIENSTFVHNNAAGGGAGVRAYSGTGTITNCQFSHNIAVSAAAVNVGNVVITRCTFEDNAVAFAGGAVAITNSGSGASSTIAHCLLRYNSADQYYGGAIVVANGTTNVNDCALIANTSPLGGGIYAAGTLNLRNTTVQGNSQYGVLLAPFGAMQAVNCIFWGNSPAQTGVDGTGPPPPPTDLMTGVTISYSVIEGGWTGTGSNNIDADPRFIQGGCGNLRLGPDSPCLDAGSNAALPPGTLLDLDGEARIQNGVVDMGAYEGPHDLLPLIACADDLVEGDIVNLVPAGGALAPMERPGARLAVLEGEGASAQLEQTTAPLHAGVGGYSELAEILRLDTTLSQGGHRSRLTIPFDLSDLGLLSYDAVDVTYFDPALGRWTRAVAANVHESPGYSGPVGDRIVVVGTGTAYGMTAEFGDHGVFWNPALQRGFAWANVDHHSDFAIGAALPLCPADCAAPHDDIVGHEDLLAVIAAWGEAVAGTPADINATFSVDVDDLVAVINGWGPCR